MVCEVSVTVVEAAHSRRCNARISATRGVCLPRRVDSCERSSCSISSCLRARHDVYYGDRVQHSENVSG